MKIQTYTPPPTSRLLRQPKPPQEPQQPQQPRGNWSERFLAGTEEAAGAITDGLYPVATCLLAGRVGFAVGSQIAGPAGALVGSLGLSLVGWSLGVNTAASAQTMVDDLGGDSLAGRAALSTALAASVGAVVVGLGVGSVTPGSLGVGLAGTLAGLAGWGVWKASH